MEAEEEECVVGGWVESSVRVRMVCRPVETCLTAAKMKMPGWVGSG